MIQTIQADQCLGNMLTHTDALYILADGARFENLLRFLYETTAEPKYFPLYKDTFYEPALNAGPFLIELTQETKTTLLDWYINFGAQQNQAIILVSPSMLQPLGEHLQNYLEAKLPTLEIALFRFYDPEVLNAFTQTEFTIHFSKIFSLCTTLYWHHQNTFFRKINNVFNEAQDA